MVVLFTIKIGQRTTQSITSTFKPTESRVAGTKRINTTSGSLCMIISRVQGHSYFLPSLGFQNHVLYPLRTQVYVMLIYGVCCILEDVTPLLQGITSTVEVQLHLQKAISSLCQAGIKWEEWIQWLCATVVPTLLQNEFLGPIKILHRILCWWIIHSICP